MGLFYPKSRPGAGKKAAGKSKIRIFVWYCCGTLLIQPQPLLSDKIGPAYYPISSIVINLNRVLSYFKKGDVCIRMRCWKKGVII